MWVCFTYPAASKSTAHEYLSFPLLLRRTHEGLLKGALGLLASSSIIRNWSCRHAGGGRPLSVVHVLPCSVLASTP